MKRNSKGTKGWGFKFIAILSSIMMVINTVTPVVPVFAEPEIAPSNDEVVDVSAENPAPAEEENTPAEKTAEDADTANNNADKPATVETPKTDEDADKSDDSQIITEQTDGNQDSDAKKDTSNGSDEKENNNTDQSLQNGENSETVETPVDVDKPAENVNLEYVVNAKSTKGISLMNVAPTVASIGETGYATFEAAWDAAVDGDTITLLKNSSGNGLKAPQGKYTVGLTVDFAEHTYTVDGATVGSAGTETQAFQLLKDNKITFKNGTIYSEKAKMLVQNYSNLTLDGMTLTLNNTSYASAYTLSNNNGNTVISGTTINANPAGKFAFDVCRYSSYPSVSVTVQGSSEINGDVEISASGSDPKDGFGLSLESGELNGNIVVDATAKQAMADKPELATVMKESNFTQTAPTGYEWVKNSNGKDELVATENIVAQIGTVKYKTFEAAWNAAQDGDTITLLKNSSGNGLKAPQGKYTVGLTVDFAEHTYTVDGATVGSAGTETQAFQLLKDNKITFKNGTIYSEKAKMLVQNYSNLTLDGMTLTLNNSSYSSAYTLSNNNGNVVISGTTINANPAGSFAFDVCRYSSYTGVSVTVRGNSVISGDVEIDASAGDAKEGMNLILESGTISGELKPTANGKKAMADMPELATVTKETTFTQTAPIGYEWVKNSNGKDELVATENIVAQIGTVKYKTFEAAWNAAVDGDTITLLKNSSGNGLKAPQGKYTQGLTVDFAEHTYTVDGATVGSAGTETQAFQLLKDNKIIFKNGTIYSEKALFLVQNYSDLTLERMTLTLNNSSYSSAYTLSNNNGNVVISGTTINANPAGSFAFDVCRYASYPSVNVTVKGNSVISGDVEISASGSNPKDGLGLSLESGELNGNIVVDQSAENVIKSTPNKVSITKETTFNQDAPAGYEWKNGTDLAIIDYRIILKDDNNSLLGSLYLYKTGYYKESTHNTEITKLDVPVKEGRDFLGYYTDINSGTQVVDSEGNIKPAIRTNLSQDKLYYAHWKLGVYQYTINTPTPAGKATNNLSNTPSNNYDFNSSIVVYKPATINAGYEFSGWNLSGIKESNITVYDTGILFRMPGNDVEVTPEVKPIEYSITYELDGGSLTTPNPATYTIESSIVINDPTKDGYTFLGWTGDGHSALFSGDTIAIDTGSTGPKTFYANWKINQYTITIVSSDANSGTVSTGEIKADYNTDIRINNDKVLIIGSETSTATASGNNAQYTSSFVDWDISDCGTKLTKNCTITGNFSSSVNKYTIKFVNDDESDLWSGEFEYGTTPYYAGTTPTKTASAQTGYTFSGWTDSTTEYASGSLPQVETGVTYKATYSEALRTYTVTFDANGGTITTGSETVNYGDKVTRPENPTKDNFGFMGWKLDGDDFNFNTAITGNITLTAEWKANKVSQFYTKGGTGFKIAIYDEDGKIDLTTTKQANGVSTDDAVIDAVFGEGTASYLSNDAKTLLFATTIAEIVNIPDLGGDVLFVKYMSGTSEWATKGFCSNGGCPYFASSSWTSLTSNSYNPLPSMDTLSATGASWVAGATHYSKYLEIPGTGYVSLVKKGIGYGYLYTPYSSFTVTYAYSGTTPDGATALPTSKTYKYSGDVVVAPNASTEGYSFSGWTIDGELVASGSTFKMPAHDVVITGEFNAEYVDYTVRYYLMALNGTTRILTGQESGQEKAGSVITGELKNYSGFITPAEQSWTLNGDKSKNNFDYIYIRSGFNVSYVTGDQILSSIPSTTLPAQKSYLFETGVTVEPYMVASGYTFQWTKDETNVNPGESFTMPAHDVVITGTFIPRDDTPYTIEYYYQNESNGNYPTTPDFTIQRTGTTDTTTGVIDSDLVPDTSKTDYVYDTANVGNISSTIISGDNSGLLKVYFKKQFTVTYSKGDKGTFEDKVVTGFDYSATPSGYEGLTGHHLSGYHFSGWSPTLSAVTGNVTYTAIWEADEDTPYTVEHYLQNIDNDDYTLIYSGILTGTTDTTATITGIEIQNLYTGFTFSGANTNNKESGTITGSGDLVLKVYLDRDTVTLTLDPSEGTVDPSSVTGRYGTSVNLPEPTKTGYTFTGWSDGTDTFNSGASYTISGDVTLTAGWQANSYVVTYHANNGTNDSVTENVTYSGNYTFTGNIFSKTGYEFSGWNTKEDGSEEYKSGLITWDIASGLDVYAIWTANHYNVEFTGGADVIGTTGIINVAYDETFTLPDNDAFTKTGYTFSGWNLGGTSYAAGTPLSGLNATDNATVTFTAEWTINDYTITYTDSSNENADVVYTGLYETSTSGITAPTWNRTGYTLSWSGTLPATYPAENTVITGNWTINSYTITFDGNGGITPASITGDYNTIITLPISTRTGYTFNGWGDSHLSGNYTIIGNVILTGQWTQDSSNNPSSSSGGGGSSGGGSSRGGGSSSSSSSNNMQEVVLGGEVEVNTGDEAEINTGDENKLEENNDNDEGKGSIGNTQGYDPELVEAYKWAYKNGITTMPTIEEARLKDGITRAELAKMMVVFMSEVLHRQPVITETFDYPDVNEKALGDLTGYIQLAYQYQIMGIQADGKPLNKFNPRGKVSRAEFATVLSRVLYGSVNNQKGANYREKHIEALNKAGILTNTNPKIQELRGWIILMLYRSQNDGTENVENNPESNTGDTVELTGAVVETQTGTIADATTGDVAGLTGEVAELTGDTAELIGSTVELTGSTQEIEEKDNKNSESLTGTEAAKPSETPSTGDAKAE